MAFIKTTGKLLGLLAAHANRRNPDESVVIVVVLEHKGRTGLPELVEAKCIWANRTVAFADFHAPFPRDNEALARRVLRNANTLIAGRIRETEQTRRGEKRTRLVYLESSGEEH
ncbi:MAG: hypothetical protein ACR2PS_08755 [Pseudomonadales bacterium]